MSWEGKRALNPLESHFLHPHPTARAIKLMLGNAAELGSITSTVPMDGVISVHRITGSLGWRRPLRPSHPTINPS